MEPDSPATWQSEVVQAAVDGLACTKQASVKLMTVKELVTNFDHAMQSSLSEENGSTGKGSVNLSVHLQ